MNRYISDAVSYGGGGEFPVYSHLQEIVMVHSMGGDEQYVLVLKKV